MNAQSILPTFQNRMWLTDILLHGGCLTLKMFYDIMNFKTCLHIFKSTEEFLNFLSILWLDLF